MLMHSFSNTKHDYTSYFVCHTVRAGALGPKIHCIFSCAFAAQTKSAIISCLPIKFLSSFLCVFINLEPSHICSAQKTARLNIRDTEMANLDV